MLKENNGQKKKTKRGGSRPGAGRKPGSPNRLPDDLKKEALSYSGDALQFYRDVLADAKAPLNWKFAAAEGILDRAVGKVSQEVNVNQDKNVNVKFETLEEIQQGLKDFGLDIRSSPLKLVDLSKNEDDE